MNKVNFGCGSNRLEGWNNFDMDVDIRKPLPMSSNSVHFILAEHVLEHTTHRQAWGFLCECKRILKSGGVVRIGVPDITHIWDCCNEEYRRAVQAGGHGDGTTASCVRAAVFDHGHESVWNEELLITVMSAVGFWCRRRTYGISAHPELQNVEGHHKVVGISNAALETAVVEGTKP